MTSSGGGNRYGEIRSFVTRVRTIIDFLLPTDQMIPWVVITIFIAMVLAFAKQFTVAGIVLSGAFSVAVVLVSLRVAAYLIWMAADIADDIRAIRSTMESISRKLSNGVPTEE